MATSASRNQSITFKAKQPLRRDGNILYGVSQAKYERLIQLVWAHTDMGLCPVKQYILTPAHLAPLIVGNGAG
ncbi:uncharacterized protein N7479_008099 [Penicillium vulpinum]|uniref:uncharacterized protein n=1 Tax=Penicillium vulpinum TaxID=29845 RepID=UPI0025485898|nr:uncharacterized protein N7479_008099 [Penicillium vulpinum]KAJ5960949.1 hypothetical protein N7479_008099 [Penicillium vulpinum]